jgi:flagellar basal body-associated protein FliL
LRVLTGGIVAFTISFAVATSGQSDTLLVIIATIIIIIIIIIIIMMMMMMMMMMMKSSADTDIIIALSLLASYDAILRKTSFAITRTRVLPPLIRHNTSRHVLDKQVTNNLRHTPL